MSAIAHASKTFVLEQIRVPVTLFLLVAIPAFFVLIFAGVLGEFSTALGGTLDSRSAIAISAGWSAAFLSGTMAFFQVAASRGADRRLAAAGLGGHRVALSRIVAALALAVTVSGVAFGTLWLRSGVEHPLHAALAILAFAAIYIGVGTLIGAFVYAPLEGSLLVILVFALDAFNGPQMTSQSGIGAITPTRAAADVLIAGAGGHGSSSGDLLRVALITFASLAVAFAAFWIVARNRRA